MTRYDFAEPASSGCFVPHKTALSARSAEILNQAAGWYGATVTDPFRSEMKTIPGVPESITRADYLKLIESVGFDVKLVTELEFRGDGIYAKVKERGPGGTGDLIDRNRNEVIVNTVYIPVRDPQADQEAAAAD